MDQEVRSSDIFTVLANLMDSQSHGMQSSQNNNNNSNPNNHSMRQNTIGTDSSLPSTQAEVSAAQVMNAHILNMTGQAAVGIPVSNGSAADAEIAEIERLSAFMNPNFTNAGGNVTSHNAQDPLYEAASQIGMQTEVGNVLDPRLAAYSSTGIDFTSSQNQALLEAFNTIDTSTVASLSSTPSYVSLLQQQPGDLWMGQSGGVSATGNYAVNTGNKQQSGNTRTPSSYTHGHNVQSSSSPMDKASSHISPHHIHSSSSKSTMLMQHTSGMQTSNNGNRTSQQYNHNAVQYRQNSKSRNDLVLPVNNDGLPLGNGKEKKLTTTPIPSDADKSSCSSTSSGSISGPEHSPDHISDHPSSSSADLSRHNMDDSVLMGLSQKGGRTIRNIEGAKNYPCYGNMNLVNFGTINFTPVMDNSHNTMSSGDAARNQQDGNIPAPTSDSVIEIDESVTSPLENIPMSPTTPMAMDQSAVMSQGFPDMQKISMGGRGSFTQMQTVTTVRQVRNADPNTHAATRKMKSGSVDPLRRPVNVHKTTDPNGNSGKITQDYGKNFASLSTVTQDKLQEKLKKPRSSKHKQGHQHRQDDFQPNLHGGEVARFDFATVNNNTHQAQPSHLKPKVNADPTIRFKQNTDTTIHPSLNQFTRQPNPQGTVAFTPGLNTKQLGSPPVNQYPNPVAHNINSTNNSGYATGGSDTPSSSRGRSRQWQTVTAVQGPKLPPMLSEQDRIPKRGRPSKKMMQQNLKVKKDNAAAKTQSVLPTQGVLPVVPLVVSQPEVVQPRLPSSNLVSTYTINDKGLMEEIAPKPKENRRSKERTQAFMKFLNDIKTSSKQQQLSSKPGEKEKTEGEKQKKRSRARTKVFGRQVQQPLTESGITETMYTFSALAHQFKISSSIVERATENLLKSAAMKRNKEQQSNALVGPHPQRPMPDKNNNHKNLQPVTQSVANKGVPLASSHCEPKTTTSSKVPNVPTIKLPGSTSFKQVDNRVTVSSNAGLGITADKVVHIRQETVQTDTRVPSTIGPKISAVSAPVPAHAVQKQSPTTETIPMPELNRNDTVEVADDVLPESISVSDSDHTSSKGKHKKKKHKKHKKRKYADSNSAKKKKKDKERKKKSKKKLKTKLTPSIIPSTSVSLVKPAMKATHTPESDPPPISKKSTPRTSAFTSRNKTNNFTSGFRQTSNTDLDIPWSQDDNTYDAEDSSSDEASASPKSNADTTPESSFSKSVSSGKLFAQYSNSRIGFGTFSIPAPKSSSPDTRTQKAPVTSVSAAILSSTESTDASFSSQGLARSGKKHSKHKKKKFFRKSKTCDPAFAAILDELLNGVKDLKLDTSSKSNQGTFARSSSNIFAATSVVDSSQSLLWRSPTTTTTSSVLRKSSSSNATTKKTAFPRSNRVSMLGGVGKPDGNKKGQLGLGKAVSLPQPEETEEAVESLSVFCRSPFFQKYGYISKSHSKPTSVSPPTVDSKKVPKSSRSTDKTTPAHTPSMSKTTTAPRKDKSSDKVDVDVGSKQLEEPTPTQAKRKRGWPRGKPRGPRAKRANTDLSPIASVTDKTLLPPPTREADEKPLFAVDTTEPKSERPKESPEKAAPPAHASTSTDNQEPKPGPSSASTGPTGDLSKLVSESLLQQIKQAIEANLPKNFNKDAINKSVDAAVQSCLQNMANTSPETPTVPESEPTKKKTGRRHIRNSSVEAHDKVAGEMSPKANTDIHPKKLWACKHQDTESSTTSKTTESPLPTPVVPKKRGPGRPRKNSLPKGRINKQPTARQSATTTKQGKVPTASATVVPSKRKLLTVRLGGKPATKQPAVKRLIARAKNDIVSRPAPKTPRQASRVISKEAALSCLSALCSIKAVKVLAKSGDKDSHTVVGFYGGTELETHIANAINTTVEMYQWDNYRRFNDACAQVEKEMGFADDMDSIFGDNRPKNLGIKKSIESVVEKLKNKQAQQSVHSAATALLELHNTASSPTQDDNVIVIDHRNPDNEKYRMPGRKQDIYEKVSPYKKDSTQSSKQHKVKVTQSLNTSVSGGPVKRPRGRPRKNPVPEDTEPPVKKQKTNTDSDHKTSRNGTLSSKDSETTSGKGKQRKGAKGRPSAGQNMDPTHTSKKPYIAAGLYSSTFKKDSKSSSHRHFADILSSKAKLPAPLDAGLYLRNTLKDFQLPYNVWWMYKHKKISPTQGPSTNYVEVTQNVYTNPRPALDLSDHICTCNPQEGENCSSKDCLNRLMYIECQSSSCPCGQSCTNQAIQKRCWCDSLERFKTKERGWGVRTTKVVSEGAFILEYVGEVVSEAEFRTRMIELYHAYSNHYCVQLDASTVIDGYRMANEGRFVNHSCEPNCEMQKWCVNGEHRIGLFALKQIQPSEELTYDYNFHAYDVNMQQECRCGSKNCRGFIGGRVQRTLSSDSDSVSNVSSTSTKQSKPSAKETKLKSFKSKGDEATVKEFSILQMKPISKEDKEMIRSQQLFLLRNLVQVRRKEEEQGRKTVKKSGDSATSSKSGHKSKPKKSHQSKEESAKVEAALTEMYTAIATCKDQNGVSVAIPFMNLPSKKKNPEYYERISDPIDLSIIERNIVSNHYKDIETFNNDVQRVFKNAEKYHGRKSTLGKDVFRLRKAYANARGAAMLLLNGHKKPSKSSEFSDEDMDEADENIHRKNEDHIRCICCIYKDEGLMVQCEKCYVWQHCDCMGVKPGNTDRYLCEECDPRAFSREVKVIPPPPNTPPGHTYFLTLLRDDLLVKQGDCAYLMRDHRLRHNSNSPSVRASHRNLATLPTDKLDIFRIEQLWTDERGDKYAYGYHFLRPNETHHAPSRTFYHNELFASPFFEIIPLEAVVGSCCVMDLYTYCKGKPKDFKMCDIYICDFRTDKAAGCFTRITKKRYPICTKPHVFDTYKHKICPKKDFQPHHIPEQYRKSSGRPPTNNGTDQDVPDFSSQDDETKKRRLSDDSEDGESSLGFSFFDKSEVGSSAWKKRQRLDGIASKLLSKLPKQAVDVSYLLEPGTGKRQRKKTQLSLESLSQQK